MYPRSALPQIAQPFCVSELMALLDMHDHMQVARSEHFGGQVVDAYIRQLELEANQVSSAGTCSSRVSTPCPPQGTLHTVCVVCVRVHPCVRASVCMYVLLLRQQSDTKHSFDTDTLACHCYDVTWATSIARSRLKMHANS